MLFLLLKLGVPVKEGVSHLKVSTNQLSKNHTVPTSPALKKF